MVRTKIIPHEFSVATEIIWSPSGDWLLVGWPGNEARLYDMKDPESPPRVLEEYQDAVFSPGGDKIFMLRKGVSRKLFPVTQLKKFAPSRFLLLVLMALIHKSTLSTWHMERIHWVQLSFCLPRDLV